MGKHKSSFEEWWVEVKPFWSKTARNGDGDRGSNDTKACKLFGNSDVVQKLRIEIRSDGFQAGCLVEGSIAIGNEVCGF
jgi:hypothetical protein